MYNVCYEITAISRNMPDWLLCELNAAAVDGLAGINSTILRHYTGVVPRLYEFAPKYYINPKVRERWKDLATVIKDGWGDCKDFTAWRLAELWRDGVQAKAESIIQRNGRSSTFHTYVRHATGEYEDPAKRLGMP